MAEDKKQSAIRKVFIDANVLVAATISSSGGSFRILTESLIRGFCFITSRYAYREAERTIQEKYPSLLKEYYQLVPFLILVSDPFSKEIERVLTIIDFKDAPVLAAAIKEKVFVLITLDRKHFIDNQKLKDEFSFLEILTPKDFIQKYFL